jgi:hypothetical protein
VGTRCADHVTPLYPQKLALTSPTGGGLSVGIVRSRTKAMELSFSKLFLLYRLLQYYCCLQHDSALILLLLFNSLDVL